jgi:hypothetical protein
MIDEDDGMEPSGLCDWKGMASRLLAHAAPGYEMGVLGRFEG